MSELLPPVNGSCSEMDSVLSYASPVRRVSRLAVWSMWMGIAGIFTAVFGIGLLVGAAGLVVGIMALVRIGANPETLDGKRYAVAGIVLGGICVPVLIFALMKPSIGRPAEMAYRSSCQANLRGIAQMMALYANDNGDVFPVVPFAAFGPANGGTFEVTGGATDAAAMTVMETPGNPVAGSPLAGPWLLVLNGMASSKQFICHSDANADLAAHAPSTDATGNYFLMFQAGDQISYSFAYPYTREGKVGGWWKNTADGSVPVASDMAPVPGTGSPKRVLSASGGAAGNSGNHKGVGQNVAFGDNHVDFVRSTAVGQSGDNIFTVSGKIGGSAAGTAPTLAPINIDGTPGNYDTVMVPEWNLDTGKLW